MGKGRKTRTLSEKGKYEVHWARNLPTNKLAAVIFGCKNHTIAECFDKEIFGLPAAHFSYVRNITPGLPLFLFNYSDRILHGIFKAASSGQMNINKRSWITAEGVENTPYPAQVRVCDLKKCSPLHEENFKNIIKNNYFEEGHFWFELDKGQYKALSTLFLSSPLQEKMPRPPILSSSSSSSSLQEKMPLPSDAARQNNMFGALSRSRVTESETADEEFNNLDSEGCSGNTEMLQVSECSYALVGNKDNFAPNWAGLFKKPSFSSYDLDDLDDRVDDLDDSLVNVGQDFIDINEVRAGISLAPSENCVRDLVQPSVIDKALQEETHAASEGAFMEYISELLKEVEGLKVSQLEQWQKIRNLESELVDSKVEINQLKNKCHILEPMPFSARGHREYSTSNLTTEKSVFIVGGFDGNSWLSNLSKYCPSEDHIISICPMTFSRQHASVSKLNGELYIFGGTRDGIWYDIVESYNPASSQWVQRPSLNRRKGSMSGATIYGKIFAVGGGNGVECFSEVELFDLYIGSWVYSQPMLEKRFAPATEDLNGALYVAGGYDGRYYLSTAERFDPREHAWTRLGDMNMKRGCHSLVAYKEKLYALGGYNGDKMVSTVEVLDPRFGSWRMGAPMTASRGYFGSFVLGEKIYAIGGLQDGQVLDVTECYTEQSGWQMTGATALGKRSFFSTLVL